MAHSLADRITRAPVPYDGAHLGEIAARFGDLPGPARELLEGTAGCSPFLAGLILREADWLRAALDRPPEASFAAILAAMPAETVAALADSLRIARRRAALLIALADLGGAWELADVTGALTDLADRAVQLGLAALVAAEIARGKLPGVTEADIPEAAGMFVIAMGKMGACELNYSSDIDLIVLFDETRHDPDDYADLRRGFIRVTQGLVKLLSESTAEGHVFRVDLRLRPDPSATPVCIASEPAEHYYESVGRTWERAAYIKARACAGAVAAGEAFLKRLTPFIWRRHLDFAAIEDAQDMRLRIRAHKGLTGPIGVPGHDLKLGQGGIREIEFFTQTRQLIVGGRDPDLRQRGTLAALAALADRGWVERDTAATLAEAYVAHRTLEHRLQMIDDAQTHRLPEHRDDLDRLADFCGEPRDAFECALERRLATVGALTEPFFVPGAGSEDAPAPAQVFADPEAAALTMASWTRLPALRSERARALFRRLRAGAGAPHRRRRQPRRGAGLARRLPVAAAGRRADLLADAGEPAAARPARRHLRHHARARPLSRRQHRRARRGDQPRLLPAAAHHRRAHRRPRPPPRRGRRLRGGAQPRPALDEGAPLPHRRPSAARHRRAGGGRRRLLGGGRGGDRRALAGGDRRLRPAATARRPAPAPRWSRWASSAAAR